MAATFPLEPGGAASGNGNFLPMELRPHGWFLMTAEPLVPSHPLQTKPSKRICLLVVMPVLVGRRRDRPPQA